MLKMNQEHLDLIALLVSIAFSLGLGSVAPVQVMKRSKIKSLIDLAGDADSLIPTLSYIAQMVRFSFKFTVFHTLILNYP
jgi:hypothetical protein